MNRYEYTKPDTVTGRKAYATSLLIDIPKSYDDRYIFSREGDRLDLLAYEFYQDTRLWFILASANNLGKGSLIVPPGIQLRIPPESIILELGNLMQQAEENR
jgi:hypothetical protein